MAQRSLRVLATLCGAALLAAALGSPGRAAADCDVIPQAETTFQGATGSSNRVFAGDGDVLILSRDEAGCDAGTPSFASAVPSDNVVTFLFTPPDGPASAVVQASAAYCASFGASGFEAACETSVGPGNAICVPYPAPPTATQDQLVVPFVTQGRAGPVKVAVSAAGVAPPCQLATQACSGQAGLAACIDAFYQPDTCSTAPQHRHESFPGLTATPVANDYADLCTSTDPSVPCQNSGNAARMTTDAAGNLVVPIDWSAILVPGSLPVPRLVRATTGVPAFAGAPPEPAQSPGAPVQVPGLGFLQSFSPKGLRLDPLFNPLFDGSSTDTTLFGSVDAERGIVRILRRSPAYRECAAGERAALACLADDECPDSTCGPARCRGGSSHGAQCTSDVGCPGGACGAPLFDFGDRYSDGGTGPILIPGSAFTAEAQNPAAIDGLASTGSLFMFVRSEILEGRDLNGDGDVFDETIVTLRDATTGVEQSIATAPGAAGRASTRMAYRSFRFPAVAVEDDLLAFLEVEAYEGDVDQNGDGDRGDALLRVFRQAPGGPVELTDPVLLRTPDPVPGIDTGPLQISDGLVFVRLSERAATARTSAILSADASRHIRMSDDGRFVIFHSDLALAPTFNTEDGNVWIHDRDADADGVFDEPGQTSTEAVSDRCPLSGCTSVTQCPTGGCSNRAGDRLTFDVTPDGRYVAFNSDYQNLVTGDTNAEPDVFLRDRLSGTTTRVSVSSAGAQVSGNEISWGGVALSDDARFVAFVSNASFPGLTCPTTGGGTEACVYVRDRTLGTTSLVLETAFEGALNGASQRVGLLGMSGDGRYVAVSDRRESGAFLVDRDANGDGQYGDQVVLPYPGGLTSRDGRFLLTWFDPPVVRFDRNPLALQFLDPLGIPPAVGLPVAQVPVGPSYADLPDAMDLSPDGRFAARILPAGTLFGNNYRAVLSDIDGGIAEVLESNVFFSPLGRLGVATSEEGLFTAFKNGGGQLEVHGIDTALLSGDLNLDGDVRDVFLAVADARGAAPLAFDVLGAAGDVALAAGSAVFLRPEAADGAGADLNGDGDVADAVVHVWRNRQAGPAVNLGLSARRVAVSGQVIAALVSEADEGEDLNGDGDTDDLVPHVNDLATGTAATWTHLGRAAGSPDLQTRGRFVAFHAEEIPGDPGQGCPPRDPDCVPTPPTPAIPGGLLIYDTLAADFLELVDPQGTPVAPPLVDDFVLGEEIAAFRVSETRAGVNLNGVVPPIPGGIADTDLDDSVLHAIDLATGTVFNSMQAAIPCPVEACDPRVPYRILGRKVTFLTLEAQQGPNDLDQNGDGGIGLVLQHFNVDALAAGGAAEDAQDILGGTLAGICTGTAAACASDLECAGGGLCYFPPGGCLFDTGESCDPLAPDCDSGELCAPIPGMPGAGRCVEFQGPCLTDGDCSAPAFCTDDGEDPERLFSAVAEQPDGRQRFVSLGRCSDGDGACNGDGDCNPGATCDRGQAVLATAADFDGDGLADPIDNCPDVPNGDQLDRDGDGIGDACDRQTCGNGIQEYTEECDHGDQNGLDGVCGADCSYVGPATACSDGIDNDGDGRIDLADPGCENAADPSERGALLACDDGVDNDGDYRVDVGGDPGCASVFASREDPACSDGVDNDGDGLVDWDGAGFGAPDPQCDAPSRPSEGSITSCGLGAELLLLAGALAVRRRRR